MSEEVTIEQIWYDREPYGSEGKGFLDNLAFKYLVANDYLYFLPNMGDEHVGVNTNDTFVYACADAERVRYEDIEPLMELIRDYGRWGDVLWAAKRRNEKPLIEHVIAMKEQGKWPDWAEELPDNYCNKRGYFWTDEGEEYFIEHYGKTWEDKE